MKRAILVFVILGGVCGVALTPFCRWGSPSGHDFEFHLFSWMEVLAQWKQGVIYPRWAGLAHWGYGEARFLFYPPGSWTLGATLGATLPWGIVPAVYCWVVLSAAGGSMYALARKWLRPADALFAAAFYAVNPYHLVIVYWRSAYAELLAGALLPLVVLALLGLKKDGARPVFWLSLALAAAWLINAPAALMIHYSVAGLAVLIAVQEKSIHFLVKTAAGVSLGAGLAAFYLVPAIYEQSWVNINQLLSAGVRPQDNFLFTTIADPDHNRFNMLVSLVALAEIAVLAVVIWSAQRRRRERNAWWLLSGWGVTTAFVMLPVSNLLWEHLPEFRFVQLPFRWLLCMNAPVALLLAMATSQAERLTLSSNPPRTENRKLTVWMVRGLVCVFLLGVIAFVARRIQPPWWDSSNDIALLRDAITNGAGYEGTDEYVPAGADPYELKTDLPRVTDESGQGVRVKVMEWNATDRHFAVDGSMARKLTMRLLNYPAWEVTVNGRRVAAETTEVTGLMVIPVAAGDNDVRIHFGRTRDRTVGGVASLVSLCVLGVAWRKTRSRKDAEANS